MKSFKILLATILLVVFSTTCFASVANNIEYYYENENITITFNSATQIPQEKQQIIADKLALGISIDSEISTYRWCWLLGHDLITEVVTATEHKVYEEAPRCILRCYEIETCSGCDYYKETLLSTTDQYCCPEE